MEITIRPFIDEDWDSVAKIYLQGIETRNATFETEVPAVGVWINKFHTHLLWVAVLNREVVGWAGLQPVSVRAVYRGVAEVTIYVDALQCGKGIGRALMQHLISESEKAGVWSLYAAIFPENKASIHLHRSAGFRHIGYREKIARLDGQWRDTVLFERRSKKVGN